jgi:2-polyprenyl-6-methoxyphenol hydroxylase-like FAD-dependent oxidoreductase
MQVGAVKEQRIRTILISGAGAAGQSLGYWLRRYGFTPTVIERAPAPRIGGFAVDLRGAAVLVAERMGILDAFRKVRVGMREIVHLDRNGEVVWKTDGNFGAGEGIAGDVEVLRDDLTRILQEFSWEGVEYIFGDSIASIAQDEAGVSVTFEHAQPRRFDLVVGADGLHSMVRSLAFGPEAEFLWRLGYYAGIFTIPNVLNLDRQWLRRTLPGKQIHIIDYGQDKHTRGLFVFASPPLKYDRSDISQQKALIEKAFEGDTSWGIPILLDALRGSTDLYFDDVAQVRMQSWSSGRVALLGDAAYAPTLRTGQGTSLAVVGAYVLAGELKAANGDYRIAFDRYEKEMRSYTEQNQRIVFDCSELSMLGTWEEVEQRERRFRSRQSAPDLEPDAHSAAVIIQSAANAIELKEYERA